jgi:hypothetical protein
MMKPMTQKQETVLAAFEKKFCKVRMTERQRVQFVWLWKRIVKANGR